MRSIVAFDLETTWLDPKSDAIIEIALVRFGPNGIQDEFSSLVNPGIPIPEDITNITGISNADVAKAPFFSEIRDKIHDFIGGSSLLAHNADFDVSFLREYGFDFTGFEIIDTFRLAEVACFDERSLNLSSLTESLGYSHEWAHRALSDVKATIFLFQKIVEKFRNTTHVERKAMEFLASVAPALGSFRVAFDEAFGSTTAMSGSEVMRSILDAIPEFEIPTEPIGKREFEATADDVMMHAWFESRPEQRKMIALTTESFDSGKDVLIEAPTWIGKTFAYGVPSILHAMRKGEKVHISTNTRTLQDQILEKDIPRLREVFASMGIGEFRVTKLKGRTNYLSILKLVEFLESNEWTDEWVAFAGKLLRFLLVTKSGELDELSFYGREFQLLEEINAGDTRVLLQENPYRKQEFLYIARENAKTADILLVNHALLLSELSEESAGNLGKIRSLVVDEAHNLESVATDALKRVAAFADVDRHIAHLETSMRRYNRKEGIERFLFPEFRTHADSIVLSFGMLFDFTLRYGEGKTRDAGELSAYAKNRNEETLIRGDFFSQEGVDGMRNVILSLRDKLREFEECLYRAPEALSAEFERPISELEWLCTFFEDYYSASRMDLIKVISVRSGQEGKLTIAPLDVSKVLSDRLWARADAVILTSATLNAGDDFAYIVKSLWLQGFTRHMLASDFDYSKQALLFIPDDLWDVRRDADRNKASDFIAEVLKRVRGRTLCLFTSFASIKETYLRINPLMKREGITLLTQGMSGGKHKMIEEFKRTAEHSALFGTDSFWEGVDIPGRNLETLIIHKFPFAVPTDPVVMARSSLYRDSFSEYALPQMLLKLRQWMGRLIRTREDKGIIILLDGRINTNWWAKIFEAFPKDIKTRKGNSSAFLQTLDAWKAKREEQ